MDPTFRELVLPKRSDARRKLERRSRKEWSDEEDLGTDSILKDRRGMAQRAMTERR